MNYVGIDPGASGGIAVLYEDGRIVMKPYNREDYREVLAYAVGDNPDECIAVVEDVHAMPKQGVTSMFTFGENKGFLEGILFAYGIQTNLVSPQKWKRYFGLTFQKGMDKAKVKEHSCKMAHKLFKDINLRASKRCKKDHDGMAEALLMAQYCKEVYGNR